MDEISYRLKKLCDCHGYDWLVEDNWMIFKALSGYIPLSV